jgi:hypothetical protein
MNWKRCFSIASAGGGAARRASVGRARGVSWIVTQRRLGTAGEFPVEEALEGAPRLRPNSTSAPD